MKKRILGILALLGILAIGVSNFVVNQGTDANLIAAVVRFELNERPRETNLWLKKQGINGVDAFLSAYPECCIVTGRPGDSGVFSKKLKKQFEVSAMFDHFEIHYLLSRFGSVVGRTDWE